MRMLRRLFCMHDYKYYGLVMSPVGFPQRKHICTKCGKIKYTDELIIERSIDH